MSKVSFLDSVSRNFDKAAELTNLPKGLLAHLEEQKVE